LGIAQVTQSKKAKMAKPAKVKKMKNRLNAQERALQLVLFQAERAWSYAMQIKEEADDEAGRSKFHLLRRLTKATKWSNLLCEQCRSSNADDRTILEAEVGSKQLVEHCILSAFASNPVVCGAIVD
jgi:hypothetical protein